MARSSVILEETTSASEQGVKSWTRSTDPDDSLDSLGKHNLGVCTIDSAHQMARVSSESPARSASTGGGSEHEGLDSAGEDSVEEDQQVHPGRDAELTGCQIKEVDDSWGPGGVYNPVSALAPRLINDHCVCRRIRRHVPSRLYPELPLFTQLV